MKKYIFFIFLTSSSTLLFAQDILKYQENDQRIKPITAEQVSFLIKNNWECQTVHIEKRNEDIKKRTRIDLLFSDDNSLLQNTTSGHWKIQRDSFLFLNLDSVNRRSENHLLRGSYGIVELTDSTLVLTRILTSTVDYRYTYHFENLKLRNKRYGSRSAEYKENKKRYIEFQKKHKQGLTILKEDASYTKVVVVTPKNCAYYEKQTQKDGSIRYTKDGVTISKFDYDYDIRVAGDFKAVGFQKPDSKEERFMRGERN